MDTVEYRDRCFTLDLIVPLSSDIVCFGLLCSCFDNGRF